MIALFLAASLQANTVMLQDGQCPAPAIAQAFFAAQGARAWPNYTEGPGARVQRQHPATGLWGQAKFIDDAGQGAVICQYYNHVGWVLTAVDLGFERGPLRDGAYWREEWMQSAPAQDQKGQEMIEVCMEEDGDTAWPSVDCSFERKSTE